MFFSCKKETDKLTVEILNKQLICYNVDSKKDTLNIINL